MFKYLSKLHLHTSIPVYQYTLYLIAPIPVTNFFCHDQVLYSRQFMYMISLQTMSLNIVKWAQ